jgi:hypothetical protein
MRRRARTFQVDGVLAPSGPFGGGGNLLVTGGSVWAIDGYHNAVVRLPLAAFGSER